MKFRGGILGNYLHEIEIINQSTLYPSFSLPSPTHPLTPSPKIKEIYKKVSRVLPLL